MASITLRQVKTPELDGTFTLVATVIASAGGIPVELFTYKEATGLFDHIATTYDLVTWGTTTPTADAYYRTDTVTLTFTDPTDAENTVGQQVAILNTLVSDYNLGAAAFTGTVDTNILGV